jgi:glycerol-3-phosphate dehydrogenase
MLSHLGKFLTHSPQKTDILSAFAGFRPLVRKAGGLNTSGISRDHQVNSSKSGLVSIIGGKWTTYRKMAEDVVDFVGKKFGLNLRRSDTKRLPLFGSPNYTARREANPFMIQRQPSEAGIEPLTDFSTDSTADVIRAVREEWACTVEDVMARRTRILFLDARKAIKASPTVASVMAGELGKDRNWEKDQVQSFQRLAERYLP